MLKKVMIYQLFGILCAQQLPYGSPYYHNMVITRSIQGLNLEIPSKLPIDLIEENEPFNHNGKDIYLFEIAFENEESIQFTISNSDLEDSSTLFFIDKETNGWVGPYTNKSFPRADTITTGLMRTRNVLIELSTQNNITPKNPISSIIHPKEEPIVERTQFYQINSNRQGNNKILLCGYWPPSNEGIRPFSQNPLLNPNGWIGENWEDRGFDIVSYFPIFSDPDCESCGQGTGDLEVDYQDTSEDWWNIVDSINPIAIITFSRGYIDHSWELEWQYFNYFYWTADFTYPYYPTPAPPDSTVPVNTRRYSSLPMDSIVSKIDSSGLGLMPYIDYTQGAGAYLSEFMGYHGVWQKAKMDSMNMPCIVAGHVHVGGLIDWDTARQAVEITVREVIKVVDQYQNLPGDINKDGVISELDILQIVGYLIWNLNLDENELERADVNFDESVDIFDLMLISNIILEW